MQKFWNRLHQWTKTLLPHLIAAALVATIGILIPLHALALDPVPSAPLGDLVSQLFAAKGAGWIATGPILIMIAVQVLKAFRLEEYQAEWNRLIVTILAIGYGVLVQLAIPNPNVWTVLIAVLFGGGGAVALYEAIKGVVQHYKKVTA